MYWHILNRGRWPLWNNIINGFLAGRKSIQNRIFVKIIFFSIRCNQSFQIHFFVTIIHDMQSFDFIKLFERLIDESSFKHIAYMNRSSSFGNIFSVYLRRDGDIKLPIRQRSGNKCAHSILTIVYLLFETTTFIGQLRPKKIKKKVCPSFESGKTLFVKLNYGVWAEGLEMFNLILKNDTPFSVPSIDFISNFRVAEILDESFALAPYSVQFAVGHAKYIELARPPLSS